jgi:SAM-dependent methyltransferase
MTRDYRDAFYDAYARTHTVPRKGALTAERLHSMERVWRAHFGSLLPAQRSARILDAGCGDGVLLWWLQRLGYDAVGVEVSEEQTAIARDLGVREVTVAPLERFLEDKREQYELVIFRNVLEHFPKDELLHVLDLAFAALRPGGRMIAQVPNGQSPFSGRIRYGDFTHEMAFTESSLGQLLGVCGFASMQFLPVPPVFLGPTTLLRTPLWKVVQFLYKCLLAAEVGIWPRVVTLDVIVTADRPA